MKRALLAIAAAAALAVAAVPGTASAAHFGHEGGHFGGGHFEGGRHFGGPHFSFGFGAAPFYDFDYVGPGHFEVHRVWTPFGWRWERVWVD
jgi:hypothetical protein